MKKIFLVLFSFVLLCACAHISANDSGEQFRSKYYDAAYQELTARALLETLCEAGFAVEKAENKDFFAKGVSQDGKTEVLVFLKETTKGVLVEISFYYKDKPIKKEKPYKGFFSDLDKKVFAE